MHAVSSLLLIARCALLLSLLVISRLIVPHLVDDALSESDYTLEPEDAAALPQQAPVLAALSPRHSLAALAPATPQPDSY